jgi:hypothetical protein
MPGKVRRLHRLDFRDGHPVAGNFSVVSGRTRMGAGTPAEITVESAGRDGYVGERMGRK